MDANVTRGQMKNLVTDRPSPITVKLAQKPEDQTNVQITEQNPVVNPPFNNWSVNQPAVAHDSGAGGKEDLGLRNLVIDGVNGYDLTQIKAENPVVNPPFNNWSVN